MRCFHPDQSQRSGEMSQEAFDNTQMSAMNSAVEQLAEKMSGENGAPRVDLARVVFQVAAETSVFEPAVLVTMAQERLARHSTRG